MRSKARFPDVPAKRGHYESFYLKLTDPNGGRGAWIRHTVHKRPGEPVTCALWFVLFDAAAAAPRATKRQFGPDQLDAPAQSYIRVGDAVLGDGRATGSVSTDALSASWDLTFADEHEPFHHLPRDFLYDAKLPKTKFLSPYPNAVYNGTLDVAGEPIEVNGWRGMVGHNWGAEHAERWVWVQGAGFEDRSPDDYFDMAVGRIKVAGMQTPWVGNGMLVLDGKPHRLGGFERVPSTEVDEQPTCCRFGLRGKGVKLSRDGPGAGQGLRRLDLRRPRRPPAQHAQLLDLRPGAGRRDRRPPGRAAEGQPRRRLRVRHARRRPRHPAAALPGWIGLTSA